jgi:hypothetical protein
MFNEDNGNDVFNSMILNFHKPANLNTTNEAKLIINAKNSLWLDYIYEEYSSLFGSKYNKFVKKRNNVPPGKNIKWMFEQGLLLSVYIETENGWEFIDYFNTVGPLSTRDMVMPIDIGKIKGEEVKIKIECGFNFWELDYAAMDFSESTPLEVNYIKSSSAIDEKGNDVSKQIIADDEIYLRQLEIGNEATVTYPEVQFNETLEQTVILHTKGYYTKIRDYKGKRKIAALISLRKPKVFTAFSKKRYYEVCKEFGIDASNLLVKNEE